MTEWTDDKLQEVQRLKNKGYLHEEIADIMGLTAAQVSPAIKRHGIKKQPPPLAREGNI